MQFPQSRYTLDTPGKINLYFDVLRRLDSGYHEIESVVVPISLFDTLEVSASSELHLDVIFSPESAFYSAQSLKDFPTGSTNLVYRAAQRLREIARSRSGTLPGARIILTKRIPTESGLGGGSSDAAAALVLLNDLWELGLSRGELSGIGADLGCDVPLFLGDFPIVCRSRGEKLEEVAGGETFPVLHLVVVRPEKGLSTSEVYRRCHPRSKQENQDAIADFLGAWRDNRLEDVARRLFNRLVEPALALSPEMGRVQELFRELPDPCLGFSMTGSGSAWFGICRDAEHAARAASFFEMRQSGTVFSAHTLRRRINNVEH
ncbi:MAG: 4-(cytidine 5'-diphospho)-2-C-methyl-D-erythritol kinase [Planctomycetia bacterium]|nr:4-(cytidine 5'-diphospho)-2-C-methyl-D-erythritol kinase [Planctomycetia bacterium]